MKVGDLVKVVWTEGAKTAPPVLGIVTKMRQSKDGWYGTDRQRVEIFSNAKLTWIERGDLEVVQ